MLALFALGITDKIRLSLLVVAVAAIASAVWSIQPRDAELASAESPDSSSTELLWFPRMVAERQEAEEALLRAVALRATVPPPDVLPAQAGDDDAE